MILSLLLAGALLRLGIAAELKAIWCDEWGSVILARYDWAQLITRAAADIHPPLYFLSLHFSTRIFGENEWAFRLPSVTASIAALVFIYLCARRLTDEQTALWTLFLSALSPYLIHLSREIRHHGMPAVFAAAAVYGYFSMLDRPRRFAAYCFLFSCAALVLTHHYGWFVIAAVGVHFFWGLLNKRPECKKIQWLMLSTAGLCAPAAALLGFHLSNGEAFTDPVTGPRQLLTLAKQSAVVYWHMICGPKYFMNYTDLVREYLRSSTIFWAHAVFFITTAVLAALSLIQLWRKDRRNAVFWTMLVIAPVLVTALTNPIRLETRYFAFMAGFLWMLVAGQLTKIGGLLRTAFAALAILVSAFGIIFISRLPVDAYHRSDTIALARYAAAHAGPEDAVVGDMQDQFLYYKKTLGLINQTPYYLNAWDLDRKRASGIQHIYYLGGFWDEDGASDLIIEHFRALGFERDGDQLIFGSEPFASMLNIFSRVDGFRSGQTFSVSQS